MPGLLERLGVEHPIVQAGMGGGLAGHELAAAVSGAGGLGTIGILPPGALGDSIDAARERAAGKPIAVNLLLPFTRRAHWDAAARWAVLTAIATLASPNSRCPTRCTMAHSTSGQRRRASASSSVTPVSSASG